MHYAERRLALMRSPRFVMHLSIASKPTRSSKVKKFAVARRTADHMLPLGILFQILKSRGSGCETAQNVRSGATAPFWIGVRRLHGLLVFALHSIPFLFR